MYNSKHPHTWDERLSSVQQNDNKSLHSSMWHNPFQVGLGFHPLCVIDVAIPFAATQANSAHVQLEAAGLITSLSAFNTSASRSMIYWTDPMLIISSAMISIGCCTSFRWETKFDYICRMSASLEPITNVVETSLDLSIPLLLGQHPVFNLDCLWP